METLLRKLNRFGPLSKEDQILLREADGRRRDIDANIDSIKEGDRPSDVYLITSGFACLYKLLEGGRRQIVAYLLPGDFCDLHCCILETIDHGISTLSPCKIICIDRPTILRLLERPAVSKALLLAALVDAATLREWVLNVGQRRAEERIAHLFCELHARLKAVGLTEGGGFDLPVTQTELADTLGLSKVHINRSLQSLRAQNLIVLRHGKLHIPDVELLEKMCGFRPDYLHLVEETGPNGEEGECSSPQRLGSRFMPTKMVSRQRGSGFPLHQPK